MRSKKKVIIILGYTETDGEGWPNWLVRELIKYGFEAELLLLPSPMFPEVSECLDFLNSKKIKVNKGTYFVGHSLGCITIARFLETLPKENMASGCVFVAGFCSLPKVPLLSDFCNLPLDYSVVREKAENFVVVMSDNDHLIPKSDSEEFAEKLGAEIIVEHNKGHFKADVRELHSVLNIILEKELLKEELREIEKLRKLRIV